MNKATAHIATAHYQTKLHNHRGIAWQADEPEEMGGSNTGPTPDELLASALATCAGITMRMYADRKQWPVETIDVTVTVERTETGTMLHKETQMTGDLTEEQRERLKMIGDKCPVHKTLLNPISISSVITTSK